MSAYKLSRDDKGFRTRRRTGRGRERIIDEHGENTKGEVQVTWKQMWQDL